MEEKLVGLRLHAHARTTEEVRREIHNSQESIAKAAVRFRARPQLSQMTMETKASAEEVDRWLIVTCGNGVAMTQYCLSVANKFSIKGQSL